jgi:16S rRNA (adenine1518-N6/adenine1519-N6)-dimethyltransferase
LPHRAPPTRRPTRPASTARSHSANPLQQHDLTAEAARAVAAGARLRGGETVLEVGPGRGALTAALLNAGAKVTAIELDPKRCAELRERFADRLGERLTILAGDALRLPARLSAPWRVVANPPFQHTAALLRRWLIEGDQQPEAIDLVLQYEAARKLCGHDGAHTRSSALLRLVGKEWVSARLRRDQVDPPSRVDLCVWSLRRADSAPPPAELARIDRLLEIAFAGPHTVADALRGIATGTQIRRQAQEQGWDPRSHPRTLPPRAWRTFAELLRLCGKLS